MRVVLLVLLGSGCAFISDKHEAWRLDPDEDGVDISSDCDDSDGSLGRPIEWFLDQDEDGFGAPDDKKTQCTKPAGYVRNSDDCDDTDPNIFPEAEELCDERDNNCDDVIDEGVTKIYGYVDADLDGYGDPSTEELVCDLRSDQVENGEDCDDSTSTWQIAQPIEVFYNGIDDNCDASDLDGDQDADGFWLADYEEVVRENGGEPMVVDPANEGDCDDVDPSINPNAMDSPYDGVDADCAGNDDYDQDADGFVPNEYVGLITVGVDGSGSLPGGDCNDHLETVHPDAVEDCSTEYDDDCDGSISAVDASGCVLFYVDADGDGYGGSESGCQCAPVYPYVVDTSDDCDDRLSSVFPGAVDPPYDGVDSDCAGDDDYDYDDDGFVADEHVGLTTTGVETSGMLPGGDCNDSDAAIHPEAVETCLTMADDNCDGSTNEEMAEACTVYYFDGDGDGYGRSTPFPTEEVDDSVEDSGLSAEDSGLSAEDSGDPDTDSGDPDTDSGGPGTDSGGSGTDSGGSGTDSGGSGTDSGGSGTDSGGSGTDSGGSDEGLGGPTEDMEGPIATSGPPTLTECWCIPTGDYTAEVGGDCNDSDVLVRPGAIDIPYDAWDKDCAGDDDFDADGDGYAKIGHAGERTLSGDGESYLEGTGELEATDCDDEDPLIHPAADEYCDLVDNDCDDEIDELGAVDSVLLYADEDGDGFGADEGEEDTAAEDATIFGCPTEGYVEIRGDCDDSDDSIYPEAPEVCDEFDDDCDGSLVGTFRDMDGDEIPDCVDPPVMAEVATATWTGGMGTASWETGKSLHIDVSGRVAVGAPSALGGSRVHVVTEMAEGERSLDSVPTLVSKNFDDPDTEEEDLYATGFGMQLASTSSITCADSECDGSALIVAAPSISSVILMENPESDRDVEWGVVSSESAEFWMTPAGAPALDGGGCGSALVASHSFALAPETPVSPGIVVGCPDAETPSVYVVQQSMWEVGLVSMGSIITEGDTEASDGFGQTLVVGDFNGDGFDDVVVGAPQSSRSCPVGNCGAVHVFQGPQMDETTIEDAHMTITGGDHDQLGHGMAVSDLDDDGLDDLLVGSDLGEGAVLIYAGSTLSPGLMSEMTEADALHTVFGRNDDSDSAFGHTIAVVPDVDGDGSPELLVGAPRSSMMGTQAGAVYGFLGPWGSGSTTASVDSRGLYGDEVMAELGKSIAVGDVGLDGTIDIIVGAPGSDRVFGLSALDWFLD